MPPRYSREITQPVVEAKSLKEQFRTSPCEASCPAGTSIQKMIALCEAGKFDEALRYLYAKNPFPGMTGRTCPHFCQDSCNRSHRNGCVRIRELERAAVDFGSATVRPFQRRPATGKTVSIIGGGPAGMTAAYFLNLLGHDVTVYEAAPVLGGMPRHAIPAFRLPRDIVDREVGRILAGGVRARVNCRVGRDISLEELRRTSDAVIIATGAPLERGMKIPGAEAALSGVAFLHSVALGQRPDLGGRTIVIGGGGTAFDCASTARRLGADVSLFYRRELKDMPAPQEDIDQASAEGIAIVTCRVVDRIVVSDGKVTGVVSHDVCNPVKDASGRVTCSVVEGSEQTIACDSVIFATGMATDLSFIQADQMPGCTNRGCIATNADQQADNGLFACGDVALGPSSITECIGQGRRAAFGVHAFLTGERSRAFIIENDLIEARDKMGSDTQPHVVAYEEIYGAGQYDMRPAEEQQVLNALTDAECRLGYTREQAMSEAARCMHCGHCKQCGTCVGDCPGYVLAMRGPEGNERPEVAFGGECWHCANCRTSCPCGAIAFEFPLFMQV